MTAYKVSYQEPVFLDTYTASAADLSAKAGRVAVLNTNGKVKVGTAATGTEIAMGLIVEAGSSDTDAPVCVCEGGKCHGLAGGTIGEGDALQSNTDGTLLACTTLGHFCVGRAGEAASSGDEFNVKVAPFRYGTYA